MSKNEQALNKLKLLLDTDVYIKLLVMFAGETIYFPAAGTPTEKRERNKAIRKQAYDKDMNITELSKLYGISESQIRRILSDKAV